MVAVFVIPFAVLGLLCTIKIWHDLPEATRRYNKSLEEKDPRWCCESFVE